MRKNLIAIALACVSILVLRAFAQTVPPFDPGSAPTEAVWNAYFASKQDLLAPGSLKYIQATAAITNKTLVGGSL